MVYEALRSLEAARRTGPPLASTGRKSRQSMTDSGFVQHRRIAREVRVRLTVVGIAEHEFMQVSPVPAHGPQQDAVQLRELD
jgi:hypothetical protein